jgi:hypothetical protein
MDPLVLSDLGVQVNTAVRSLGMVSDIVVPTHVVQRHLKSRSQESEIFRRKVAAGQDELDVGKGFPVDSLMEGGMHII